MRVSEFPCAVVVSAITSGTYMQERLAGWSAMILTRCGRVLIAGPAIKSHEPLQFKAALDYRTQST